MRSRMIGGERVGGWGAAGAQHHGGRVAAFVGETAGDDLDSLLLGEDRCRTAKPDLTYDPLNATGADAYPITAPTYILAYTTYSDAAVGNALKAFIKYVLTTGQETAPSLDFAPLPKDLANQAIAQLDKITVQ